MGIDIVQDQRGRDVRTAFARYKDIGCSKIDGNSVIGELPRSMRKSAELTVVPAHADSWLPRLDQHLAKRGDNVRINVSLYVIEIAIQPTDREQLVLVVDRKVSTHRLQQ